MSPASSNRGKERGRHKARLRTTASLEDQELSKLPGGDVGIDQPCLTTLYRPSGAKTSSSLGRQVGPDQGARSPESPISVSAMPWANQNLHTHPLRVSFATLSQGLPSSVTFPHPLGVHRAYQVGPILLSQWRPEGLCCQSLVLPFRNCSPWCFQGLEKR